MSWIETRYEAEAAGPANAASGKVGECRTLVGDGRTGQAGGLRSVVE